jgi:hypothetical protein
MRLLIPGTDLDRTGLVASRNFRRKATRSITNWRMFDADCCRGHGDAPQAPSNRPRSGTRDFACSKNDRRVLSCYFRYYHRSRTHLVIKQSQSGSVASNRLQLARSSHFPRSVACITARTSRGLSDSDNRSSGRFNEIRLFPLIAQGKAHIRISSRPWQRRWQKGSHRPHRFVHDRISSRSPPDDQKRTARSCRSMRVFSARHSAMITAPSTPPTSSVRMPHWRTAAQSSMV